MDVKIYIDLDGTVCDLVGAVRNFRNKYSHLPDDNISYKYPWSIPGFFKKLKPIPGSIESVKELALKYDVWFLSRPSFKNTHSYTEKADWVNKHFGYEMQKKLILGGDKSLLKGRILIDDSDNANQSNFDGVWIRIGSDQYPDWPSVMKRVEEVFDIGINSL